MKIRNITAALALSFAVAVPAAQADTTTDEAKQAASVDQWFRDYDRNHDQQLTSDEFSLGKTFFRGLDIDKNGFVTREEALKALATAKEKNAKKIDWTTMDTDGDGYVTVREWTGTPEEFDAHDLDGDRVLSSYDRALAREHNRAASRLKAFDKNGDGLVSQDEWPPEDSSFRQRDRNRDGVLNLDELAEDVKRKD